MIKIKDVSVYSTKEVAQILGYNDDSYIRKLIMQRKLTSSKIGGINIITGKDIKIYQSKSNSKKNKKVINITKKDIKSVERNPSSIRLIFKKPINVTKDDRLIINYVIELDAKKEN